MRAMQLAELLFNLQHNPGFEAWLKTFQKRDDVEAFFAELEAVKFLKQRKLTVQFHEPSGVKDGQNFDLFIESEGKIIPAEVKCRLEVSELSESKIVGRLKEARSQLPYQGQSVIILRVPGSWFSVEDSTSLPTVISAIEKYLRTTLHVTSVIFIFSLATYHGAFRFDTPMVGEVTNKRTNSAPILSRLNTTFIGYSPGWTYLPFFFGHVSVCPITP